MLKHLFVLIWNKKKQHFVLLVEMLVSFLVLFGIFTMMVYYYKNYRKPLNFTYENVWVVEYHNGKMPDSVNHLLYFEALRNQLKSMKEVKEVTFMSNNSPFSMSTNQNTLSYKGQQVSRVNTYIAGKEFPAVLGSRMVEGRWFGREDAGSKLRPLVINRKLRDKLFGSESAIGKVMEEKSDRPFRLIGVIEDMKDKGDYQELQYGMYQPVDTGSYAWLPKMLVKVTPAANTAFEGKLYKAVSSYLKDANVEIEHLTEKRISMNKMTLIPMIVMVVVAGFLVVNVALGLFGVLWYAINRRKAEIGLRRAIGATGSAVSRQLVYEAMVLASIALIVGVFFAVQFPILHVFNMAADVYLIAIGLAVLFIYLLVILCAVYPGRQAAAIYPAVALHEN